MRDKKSNLDLISKGQLAVTEQPDVDRKKRTTPAVDAVLHQGRLLHRAAKKGSVAIAMPVLRRLYQSGVCSNQSLVELFKARQSIQRKHVLRMLAIEAGYVSWERYRPALASMTTPLASGLYEQGYSVTKLSHWFSSFEQAQGYAKAHGGKVVKYGQQAVVIADETMKLLP